MGTTRSQSQPRQDAKPWTMALLNELPISVWQDYRTVVDRVSRQVPPELGFRKGEYYRQYHYKKSGKEPAERRYGSREDTVRTGQRIVLTKSIQSLQRHGRIEVEYDSGSGKRKRPVRIRRLY